MINGKVIFAEGQNLAISRGYKIEGSTDYSGSIADRKYGLPSRFPLLRRFQRAEVTGLYGLADRSVLAIAKKGFFVKRAGSTKYVKAFQTPRGSKPLNLCILPNGHVFFGEYFQNMEKKAVNVYGSTDNGQSWSVVYTFPEGAINHVHGLSYDKYTGRMWVLTGDRENECIIGYTEDEFKTFVEVFRGGQEYRSCQLFFYPDFIVYATDTQYAQNKIKCFDRKTLEIKELTDIQGSAIKGGQVGDVSFLSTTVEPSDVNTDKYAHVWVTKDGLHWKDVYKARKDWLPSIFQFGTFEFPRYETDKIERLYFSGRAVKGLDGKTTYIDL